MSLEDTAAVILCGGLGTRLRSEIGEKPKVMAQVGPMPFLELLVKQLMHQGINEIILCTGYKADVVEKHFKSKKFNATINFSQESEPLGTGGALKNAQGRIKKSPFFVLNGDSYCSVNLSRLLTYHQQKKALATIVVSEVKDRGDFGTIALDSDKHILAFKEKINFQNKKAKKEDLYVNAGIYCFLDDIFGLMEATRFSLEHDFFPRLIKQTFYGFVTDEPFYDIGTPQRYKKVIEVLKKKIKIFSKV